MRFTVERVVGEVVATRERAHFGRTQVVGSAAAVQPSVSPQVVVVRCYVTRTAPFGP